MVHAGSPFSYFFAIGVGLFKFPEWLIHTCLKISHQEVSFWHREGDMSCNAAQHLKVHTNRSRYHCSRITVG